MTPEVACLRINMVDDAVLEIEERSLTNQLLLEYIDQEAASATPEHAEIVQLRTDLIDVLELDCNERLLRDEPDALINEWILRSNTLQTLIVQIEDTLIQPELQRFNGKVLTEYILKKIISDLRTDENRHDLLNSIQHLLSLPETQNQFVIANEKLFADSVYISDSFSKSYGEETITDLFNQLVIDEASGPIFKEFIQEKNGIIPEVECLRVEFLEDAVTKLKEQTLLNQILLEYADKDAAVSTEEHVEIVQLRTDLIDVLELDCNERLLRDEPDELINEWIRRSSVL